MQQPHILDASLASLKGIGPQKALALSAALELVTYGDLLEYFPYRYFDRTAIHPIVSLDYDMDYAQVGGVLTSLYMEGEGRKSRIRGTLSDGTSTLDLTWFGQKWLLEKLHKGDKYIAFGKVTFFQGQPQMANPDLETFAAATSVGGLQPLYSTTERLTRMGITNRNFARFTQSLFERIGPEQVPENLPLQLLAEEKLMGRYDALRTIHFPPTEELRQAAVYRLKWEELLASQLAVAKVRSNTQARPGLYFPKVAAKFNTFFSEGLPFQLTEAQKRVVRELRGDTITGRQMNRLIQGDVGSGKTIVAVLAMLLALDNGFQACLMAPTEILARQHYEGISALLEPLHIPVALLTGSVKAKPRRDVLKALAAGALPILIGTHALLEDKVVFENLGLAVIDEQHRFGVEQRSRLWAKNTVAPHVRFQKTIEP